MVCPFCNAEDTAVVDSRKNVDGDAIRRRRECSDCATRFTTYEKSEIELIVKAGLKRIADMNNDISDEVFQTLNLAGFLEPVEEEEEDDEDVRLFDITKKMEELVKA